MTLALGVTLLAPPAQAQIKPLRLKTQKNVKKETRENRETVTYTIDLQNVSTATLSNVVLRWAFLYKNSEYSEIQLQEGNRPGSLGIMQKMICETDPIVLQYSPTRSWDDSSPKRGGILCYYVEGLVNGAVVASDYTPADAKKRIGDYRKAHAPPPAPHQEKPKMPVEEKPVAPKPALPAALPAAE
jgi:hypothetical protein